MKCWWLKNNQISLAKSHFGYNLRTRFFPSMQFSQMLMNRNNFHFTQIPDKTNDLIFLKSPKTMFLGHFRSFSHTTIYGPNIMQSFRKSYWANPVKTYGQTEGWMDRPYFTGPFLPRLEFQQLLFSKWLVGITPNLVLKRMLR